MINLTVNDPSVISLTVGGASDIAMTIDGAVYRDDHERYEGSYIFTPSNTAQVIETKNLILDKNITVEAIPSNYGLVTWDGSTITVS